MGNGASQPHPLTIPAIKRYSHIFDTMQLSQGDIDILHEAFASIADGRSTLSPKGALWALKIYKQDDLRLLLAQRILSEYCPDGKIDCGEYIITIWMFLSTPEQDLTNYLFDLLILENEVTAAHEMVKVATLMECIEVLDFRIMEDMEAVRDRALQRWITADADAPSIDRDAFLEFANREPIFQITLRNVQKRFAKKIASRRFWARQKRNREQLTLNKRSNLPIQLNKLRSRTDAARAAARDREAQRYYAERTSATGRFAENATAKHDLAPEYQSNREVYSLAEENSEDLIDRSELFSNRSLSTLHSMSRRTLQSMSRVSMSRRSMSQLSVKEGTSILSKKEAPSISEVEPTVPSPPGESDNRATTPYRTQLEREKQRQARVPKFRAPAKRQELEPTRTRRRVSSFRAFKRRRKARAKERKIFVQPAAPRTARGSSSSEDSGTMSHSVPATPPDQ